MKQLRELFDDWLTRAAGAIFVLMIALIAFNLYSDIPQQYPLLGVLVFSLVPILFVLGGVIFFLAIISLY